MAVNDHYSFHTHRTVGVCPTATNVANVCSLNSLTSAAPWIACKGASIQDSPHGKLLVMDSRNMSPACPTHATSSLACLFTGPIALVRDLVCRLFTRDPRPAVSKTEVCCEYKRVNSIPQKLIQNLFYSMPCRIEIIIAAFDGYTKYG
ncbi:hypothetical protein TNCV_3921201 [Trichonephila clavipes]|nr:hypothetical protein TNCV_3921201 [Trichonephila clavipes]